MIINVKGVDYSVKFVKTLKNESGESIVGLCKNIDKVMYVVKDKDRLETCRTIIHELLHAYIFQCGLCLGDSEEDLVVWAERSFIQIVSNFFYIIFHSFCKDFTDNQIKSVLGILRFLGMNV